MKSSVKLNNEESLPNSDGKPKKRNHVQLILSSMDLEDYAPVI
jgi:hypothetical protein